MIKGDYDRLNDLASRNVCSEHKTPLEVAWHSAEKVWVLRCGHAHYPDTITRELSLTEGYKAGEELPGHIEDKIKKRQRGRGMQQGKESTAMALGGVPASDLGTGELLPLASIKTLVSYARRYKLDPRRGHVVLMYSKPYITIDGYLYHAHQSGIAYSLVSRPVTTDEINQYKLGPTDHAWIAEVNITETGQKFTGIGIVTYQEMTEESAKKPGQLRSPVVAAHPWQIAQKRAEWQALRRAYPIGEPEEIKDD